MTMRTPPTPHTPSSQEEPLADAVRRSDDEIEARETKVKRWMWNAVTVRGSAYIGAGHEVQTTSLAEDAAHAFSLYYDDVEYEIPDVVFDWAYDIASAYEAHRDNDGEES